MSLYANANTITKVRVTILRHKFQPQPHIDFGKLRILIHVHGYYANGLLISLAASLVAFMQKLLAICNIHYDT